MKIALLALNAKFIHTNLAVHSLKRYYDTYKKNTITELEVKEFTINNDLDQVLRSLAKGQYDCVFASAYIWNIHQLDQLFEDYKKLFPDAKVIFGGPEVTYDPIKQLESKPYLDAIIFGEGEKIFLEVVEQIQELGFHEGIKRVPGTAYRTGAICVANEPMPPIEPLDLLPFPYENSQMFDNRIIYYESSRGCPYRCSYCLSSAVKGLRHLSFERVKEDMLWFLDRKVPQVKFVDRTFNALKTHALPILEFLIKNDNGITNFHFEITATQLDESYYQILKHSRPGLFQFEVGIQTTHEPTMHAIQRPMGFEKVKEACMRIMDIGGIHLHVDLIAGLPYETFERFLNSFDDVYSIGADQLQLGFLKILKGTPISDEIQKHKYQIRTHAPYEVLENRYISFQELSRLKDMEALLEYYDNSGKFKLSLKYLMKKANQKPSAFYMSMVEYFDKNAYFDSPIGTYRLYELLYDFHVHKYGESDLFKDVLKADYYYSNMKGDRELFNYNVWPNFNEWRLSLLKNADFVAEYLGIHDSIPPKQILKNVTFATFMYDIMSLISSDFKTCEQKNTVMVFDYSKPAHVTMRCVEDHWITP